MFVASGLEAVLGGVGVNTSTGASAEDYRSL